MGCVRLYSDAAGESHFEDFEIELHAVDFAPPAPPMLLSAYSDVSRFAVLSCPPDWHGDWHPASHRQWMLILSGKARVEVSDGDIREFGAGDIALLEDTTGRGRRSEQSGDEPFLIGVVQWPADA